MTTRPPKPAVDDFRLEDRPSLREMTRQRLEQLILDGIYQPGTHLVENDLSKQLGVSRGPIREALQFLQLDGWVVLRPRHGSFVHSPNVKEVRQCFQVRAILSAEMAGIVAKEATEADVATMREFLARAKQAIKDEDKAALNAANAEMHHYIHQVADNAVLEEMVSILDKRVRWYSSSIALERAEESYQEHVDLVDAIAAGDAERAAEVTRVHNRNSSQAVVHHFVEQDKNEQSA
jgi:DNA-binding GntR family transcriptional regulator